jgi:hypothetical protein
MSISAVPIIFIFTNAALQCISRKTSYHGVRLAFHSFSQVIRALCNVQLFGPISLLMKRSPRFGSNTTDLTHSYWIVAFARAIHLASNNKLLHFIRLMFSHKIRLYLQLKPKLGSNNDPMFLDYYLPYLAGKLSADVLPTLVGLFFRISRYRLQYKLYKYIPEYNCIQEFPTIHCLPTVFPLINIQYLGFTVSIIPDIYLVWYRLIKAMSQLIKVKFTLHLG